MVSEVCHSLEKLNIDEVNYLSDESVNTFVELRGGNMKVNTLLSALIGQY